MNRTFRRRVLFWHWHRAWRGYGAGFEPRLVGAIASAQKGALTGPVKGMSGVYVFVVDDVQTSEKQTSEAEKVRAQAMAESMAQQFAIPAVQQMAEIEDLRGQYF